MSAWRALVDEIHRHGPIHGTRIIRAEVFAARRLGLIGYDAEQRWTLTELGLDFCEGRVVQLEERPGGRRFVATWLRALPRNLSLAHRSNFD